MFAFSELSLSTQKEEMISYKYMDVICALGHYFDAIIYAIGALILSGVILVGVWFFCECMFVNNNGANGFIVLL